MYFLRRQWHPTPVLLPGKSHGRRSLVGCSPWGRKESDTTEQIHFHFSLSCIGEGNGNPLQCSCLENPRDRGAWWAAVYGVTQSRTRLKRLGSSGTGSAGGAQDRRAGSARTLSWQTLPSRWVLELPSHCRSSPQVLAPLKTPSQLAACSVIGLSRRAGKWSSQFSVNR